MTRFAISLGSANRFIGIEASAFMRRVSKLSPVEFDWSSIKLRSRSVATPPGQIVFIVTPESAKEREADFDNAATPARIAAETLIVGVGSKATVEEMLIKRPHFF